MYGFPLTIYFLTSVLPVEIPLVHYSGHLWATLLGYGPVGAAVEMAIGYTFVGTGLVMIITGWSKVYFSSNQLLTDGIRSEEHTSELQSLMRISYTVFCSKKKRKNINKQNKQR